MMMIVVIPRVIPERRAVPVRIPVWVPERVPAGPRESRSVRSVTVPAVPTIPAVATVPRVRSETAVKIWFNHEYEGIVLFALEAKRSPGRNFLFSQWSEFRFLSLIVYAILETAGGTCSTDGTARYRQKAGKGHNNQTALHSYPSYQ